MDHTIYANSILVHQKLNITLKGQFLLTSVRFETILPKKFMINGVQGKGYKLENLKEKTTPWYFSPLKTYWFIKPKYFLQTRSRTTLLSHLFLQEKKHFFSKKKALLNERAVRGRRRKQKRVITLIRLRINGYTIKNSFVGNVCSKRKKNWEKYLMKRKCSFIGAITEQSIQT